MRNLRAILCVVALVAPWGIFSASSLAGLTPDEVLVVVNDSSPISVAIGDYYAALRGIPAENVLHLPAGTSSAETVDRTTYNAEIRDPIRDYLENQMPQLKDQILCIVTVKGVPLRVSGATDYRAAVDSELTQLFTGRVGDGGQRGSLSNMYYGDRMSFRHFRDQLGHQDNMSYLVTRLTGYQTDVDPVTGVPADILALMDRSVAPPAPGLFLLDEDPNKTGGYLVGNIWMDQAEIALGDLGEITVVDRTNTFVHNQADIVGYASWGSNDCCDAGPPYYGEVPPGSGDVYPGVFLPRAVCTTYVSTSGRTFTDPPSYGQSLVADLVRQGACAAGGHVYEPYLTAVPRPQHLLVAYALGYSVAEAYYQCIVSASWMNVIVADPLMIYRDDFGPPSILAVDPPEGPLIGGEVVTVSGSEFREDVEVLFAGVPAPQVTWIDLQTLEVTTPRVPQVGPVDVTVQNPFGSDTLAGGYTLIAQPVDLQILDQAHPGQPVTLQVTGPPLRPYALLVDKAQGQKCFKGGTVCFDLAFTGKLRILHDSIQGTDDPLDEYGDGFTTITLPDGPNIAEHYFYFQGVVKTSEGFVVTPLRAMYVYP